MRKTAVAVMVAAILAAGSIARAAEEELTPEKKADIISLLDATGAMKMGVQLADAVIGQFLQALQRKGAQVPETVIQSVRQETVEAIHDAMMQPGGFMDMAVPLYHKYYSHQEIRQLLEFYRSPLGGKVIRVMPDLTRESLEAGQAWGRTLGPVVAERVKARLQKEGIEITP